MKISKSRMISIRLSNQEYSAVKAYCGATNALTVSNFARSALMRCLNLSAPDSDPSAVQAGLFLLQRRVDSLEHTIAALNKLSDDETITGPATQQTAE